MGRRGENIRKRKDGRWEARFICRYDMDGRAVYHSVYGKTYLEVKEKRNVLLAKETVIPASGTSPYRELKKITVSQLLEEWLNWKKDMIKESTFVRYHSLINKHILPELGGYYLSSLSAEMVNTFLRSELRGGKQDGNKGLSAKTVLDIRSILILSFEYARQQKYPCMINGKLFSPRNQQPAIQVLTREEQGRLEKILFDDPHPVELGILIALYGGLRVGELCALQWGDIQLENGIVRVSKTMMRIPDLDSDGARKTKILIDCPKTESSNRIIPLPAFLITFLSEYRKEGDAYILTGTSSWMEPRLCQRRYKKVLERAKLPCFTFHTLRHTFATRCVEMGFDTKSLSEILGHANVSTTLQRYVHPSLDVKKEQMERLEKISVKNREIFWDL